MICNGIVSQSLNLCVFCDLRVTKTYRHLMVCTANVRFISKHKQLSTFFPHFFTLWYVTVEFRSHLTHVCACFNFLLCYVVCLHAVREPREQIADAEAVLDIANSFFQCLRETKRKSSLSPATFVSYLINKFRVQTASVHHDGDDESPTMVDWGKLGLRGCGLFRQCPGLSTM